MADPTHIIIDNWLSNPWYIELAPMFIAIVAVVVSLISLHFSRREHINSIRPFIWASEFAHLDEQQLVVPVVQAVMLKVLNAPAKIYSAQYSFEKVSATNNDLILDHKDRDFFRYPDSQIQWTFTFNELDKELNSIDSDTHIERHIKIIYGPLSGNQKYYYHSRAKFLLSEKKWEMIEENAN